MATFKNLTNAEIVPRAMMRDDAETTTGNMSTLRVVSTYFAHHKGSMPSVWHKLYAERVRAALIDQVIYSYSTPIAWFDREHGWIIPDVTYSATTSSKHQTHLYRLKGRTLSAPYDATPEDARRVLSGELVFTSKGYGLNRVFTGTVPGPNYVRENTDPVILAWLDGHDIDDTAQDARNYLAGTTCECCGVDFGGAL